ncbi:MAG: AMP-binding protein, partial [Chloroflexi bacterium]|nr:AMP-binding protein [Chloroflexota bacterium]
MADVYAQKPWLKSYDKHVPANLQYPDKPYQEIAQEVLNKFPNRAAMHYMGHTFTFKQLDDMSCRLANYLVKNGVSKGDIVGVHLPNLPAYYVSVLGIQKAGCVLSGVSPLLTAAEL